MNVNAYLNFDGRCREAFEFYERCLGARLVAAMSYADMPAEAEAPPEWRDRILHARLLVGDGVLMGSDVPPGRYERPQGLFVTLQVDEPGEAERVFAALAEGGEVRMPLQATFWAARFGMLVDRFGTPWMVNCEGRTAAG
jgi:PhnB protein